LANELLDNLPFHLLERTGEGWLEVRVGAGPDRLVEVPVPARPDLATEAGRLAPDAPSGARLPLQLEARAWLRDALGVLERGRVVMADYASTTPFLARRPWQEWVRTYRHHARGGHPLEAPGTQDITCEVAVDQLARVRAPAADRSQAEFLAAHGIDDLVAEARRRWEAGAATGGFDAVRARSRVSEAAALTDPAGLGAFRVLEWTVP
ncbi:MAG: SAM-dependent methyltransferase, partial [Acidimicrobiales bacterium]